MEGWDSAMCEKLFKSPSPKNPVYFSPCVASDLENILFMPTYWLHHASRTIMVLHTRWLMISLPRFKLLSTLDSCLCLRASIAVVRQNLDIDDLRWYILANRKTGSYSILA